MGNERERKTPDTFFRAFSRTFEESIRKTLKVIKTAAAGLLILPLVPACDSDSERIRIPTRPCAVEGSPQAQGQRPGETANGDLIQRIDDTRKIWAPANLYFSAPPAYPVIADPSPPGSGLLGDLDAGGNSTDVESAAKACQDAWAEYDPVVKGPFVVNARAFFNGGQVLGFTLGAPKALYVDGDGGPLTGQRGDDLCGSPRHLTTGDTAGQYTVLVDPDLFGAGAYAGYDYDVALAHELGHVLFLGHGNGLDDNNDGLEPPDDGVRRYDEFCDPLWINSPGDLSPVEDNDAPSGTCSLMKTTGTSCRNLTPLQVEQARAVAMVTPGASMGGVVLN